MKRALVVAAFACVLVTTPVLTATPIQAADQQQEIDCCRFTHPLCCLRVFEEWLWDHGIPW